MPEHERAFYEAVLERVREMRGSMEKLAKDFEKIGIKGTSFDQWRDKLESAEKDVQYKIDRLS